MLQTTICIVGTDKRQDYLAEYLSRQGFPITRHEEFSAAAIKGAGLLIGPVTFYKNKKLLPEIEAACKQEKVPVLNYMASEEFLLQNAALTAEGFLSILIANTPFSLLHARILLLGLGRCGKALFSLFKTLDIPTEAYDLMPDRLENAGSFNVVVNTIPAPVVTRTHLESLDPSCFLFDIASAPGGFEPDAVSRLNMTLITCPGIPGKTSPQSAGYAIGEAALSYLN